MSGGTTAGAGRTPLAGGVLAARARHLPLPQVPSPGHQANVARRYLILCCGDAAALQGHEPQLLADLGTALGHVRALEQQVRALGGVPMVAEDAAPRTAGEAADAHTDRVLDLVHAERRALDRADGGDGPDRHAVAAARHAARPTLRWTHDRAQCELLVTDALTGEGPGALPDAAAGRRGAKAQLVTLAALAVAQVEALDRVDRPDLAGAAR